MNNSTVNTVYVLIHIHHSIEEHDVKLNGVYASYNDAIQAIERLKKQLGFCDHPDDFLIKEYELDKDYWPSDFLYGLHK